MSEPPEEDHRGFGNLAVAIGVVVLIAIAWLLVHLYTANQQMENCRLEGRRNCDPIPLNNS